MPPLPVIVCVNAIPTVPLDNVAGNSVIAGHTGGGIGAAAITSARAIVCAQPLASVPRIVNVDAPDVVGVPKHTGRGQRESRRQRAHRHAETVRRRVPPLPVIVCVNATPTVPLDNVAGNSVIVGHTGGTGVALQPPLVLFPDSVTGPPVANASPVRLVPMPIVTPVCATTLPGKLTPLSVAALPTCQKTRCTDRRRLTRLLYRHSRSTPSRCEHAGGAGAAQRHVARAGQIGCRGKTVDAGREHGAAHLGHWRIGACARAQ